MGSLLLLASLPTGLVVQHLTRAPSRRGRAALSMALPWRSGLGQANPEWRPAFDSALANRALWGATAALVPDEPSALSSLQRFADA